MKNFDSDSSLEEAKSGSFSSVSLHVLLNNLRTQQMNKRSKCRHGFKLTSKLYKASYKDTPSN